MSNVAVLVTRSSSNPPLSMESLSQAASRAEADPLQTFQNQQATDSLIQVIEKLSKIVDRGPQHRFALGGHKRSVQLVTPKGSGERGMVGKTRGAGRGGEVSLEKRIRRSCKDAENLGLDRRNMDDPPPLSLLSSSLDNVIVSSLVTEEVGGPVVDLGPIGTGTCYQCSLCPYLSQTLPQLKEHLKEHNKLHTDLLLMCSRCHFTSHDQALLEAHVQQHLDQRCLPELDLGLAKPDWDMAGGSTQLPEEEKNKKEKWYSYEEYGLYRCLICSYVCSQQRMLKTHAWKHAGLVDCSYPIFEDEEDRVMRREVSAFSCAPGTREKVVVVSSMSIRDKTLDEEPTAFRLQLFATPVIGNEEGKNANKTVSCTMKERQKLVEEEKEQPGGLSQVKHQNSDEPLLEVQVKTEEDCDLLSSAQKIIHSGPNNAGHINVIVERLPSAEDSLLASNPLLLGSDLDQEEALLLAEEEHMQQFSMKKEEGVTANNLRTPSVPAILESSVDENIPPLVVGRKRTHSESLRLHSLAAEALVAMPMRTPEVAQPHGQSSPVLPARAPQEAKPLSVADLRDEEDGPATKGGISLSLLTVIERLRERSDQNASDEDILKELRDNVMVQSGSGGGCVMEPSTVVGNRNGSFVCSIPSVDTVVTCSSSSCSSLVEYLPGSERPYRCRLCRYSSNNKGYVKQHLRVHRPRQPYECPICEHVASDSQDLESHTIHHCKAGRYQCKLCSQTFHYKVRGPYTRRLHTSSS